MKIRIGKVNASHSLLGGLIDSVKHLLSGEGSSPYSDSSIQLALTVMLVDVALVDNDFDDDEYRAIHHVLRAKLGIDSPEAHELISEAREVVKQSTEEVESFSTFLLSRLNETEREKLVIDLVELMGTDGVIHPFEVDLKLRYEKLLGLK